MTNYQRRAYGQQFAALKGPDDILILPTFWHYGTRSVGANLLFVPGLTQDLNRIYPVRGLNR